MMFDAFCRAHGLLVDGIEAGRWVRVPTEDHPRTRNGAYKYLGDVGFVQNHATMTEVAVWRPEADEVRPVDVARIRREAEAYQQRVRDGWQRAAVKAAEMVRQSRPGEHDYLHFKGLGDERGLVHQDGSLLVPMRHWRTNALVGLQVIRWDGDARKWDKRMLPGMRAKGATLRLGPPRAPRLWLVEGYATGLSVLAALRAVRSRDAVLICFSAGNLTHVSSVLGGEQSVFADHDVSGAGQAAAKATGARWCMSDVVGNDANDDHMQFGLFSVAKKIMEVRRQCKP